MISRVSLALLLPLAMLAQLTPDQRESDFRNMTASLAKFYAPLAWKGEALGVDALSISGWVQRARTTRTDLHFHEICAEYLATLQDGHTAYRLPSTFTADLGIRVDLYEGKPLLYQVSRTRYPLATYPELVAGAELVSVDEEPALALIERLAKQQGFGFRRAGLRWAALASGFRRQSLYPRAVELPDQSNVVVRNADGGETTYQLTWLKSGEPFREQGTPLITRAPAARHPADLTSANIEVMAQLHPARSEFLREAFASAEWAIAGFGSRNPYFALPRGFQLRRGRSMRDTFFSGTYTADGFRIGYLRIGDFVPASATAALRELDEEVAFFQANTDGLVLDVTRNNGGSANLALDYMRRFMSQAFFYPPFSLTVRQDRLNAYAGLAATLTRLGAERWVIDRWTVAADAMRDAGRVGGGTLTGPVPIVIPLGISPFDWGPLRDDNFPLINEGGASLAYQKPMIVLADDFSVSAGDLFPALFQDNERAPVVGYRTGGLGAVVLGIDSAMPYSEGQFSYSEGMMVRKRPIATPEYPTAPWVENIGVRPDVEIDFQTRENLRNNGRPFVEAFTQALVQEIRRANQPGVPTSPSQTATRQ